MIRPTSYNKNLPVLLDGKLRLDAIQRTDLSKIAGHLSDPVFHANTSNIPYPYTIEDAKTFYTIVRQGFLDGRDHCFAIRHNDHKDLLGLIGIHKKEGGKTAEAGYWLAKQHWNKGFASAALALIIKFAFEQSGYHKITAGHFAHNTASGRVMIKCGMKHEATLREHVYRNGMYNDLLVYSIFNSAQETH